MKKIRNIIILLLIVFVTGCSKEYTLIIKDNKITEKFDIVLDDNDENSQRLELDYFPLHANEEVKYIINISKNDGKIDAHFEYEYQPNEFVNANTITSCFANREIVVDNDEYYYFKLGDVQDCMSDFNLDINIIAENKVIESNADEIKGNKYIWHLTDEKKDKFELMIKIKKNIAQKKKNKIVIFIIGAIILIAIPFIYLIVKKKKSNSI